jgi:hypothetical protein
VVNDGGGRRAAWVLTVAGVVALAGGLSLAWLAAPGGPDERTSVAAGGSMVRTVQSGDQVSSILGPVHRGDIVQVSGEVWGQSAGYPGELKRVIGIGGDRISTAATRGTPGSTPPTPGTARCR